jgi:hypothetical protein
LYKTISFENVSIRMNCRSLVEGEGCDWTRLLQAV